MKKLVTLLLTAALAITAATTAFADHQIGPDANGNPNPSSKQIDVTYKVDPSYTVKIPANITLNTTTPSKAKVEATGVTIPKNQKLKVTLNSDKNFCVKTSEGAELKYNVTKGNNSTTETAVDNTNNTVLEVKSGSGSTELTFTLKENVVYSGTYTDTVTFTVSLVTNP